MIIGERVRLGKRLAGTLIASYYHDSVEFYVIADDEGHTHVLVAEDVKQ